MLALKIIAAIVLIFVLIGQIRVGADISITDGKLALSAKVCDILIRLLPRDGKKKKKEAPKEPDKKAEEKPKPEKKKKEKPKKDKKPRKPFFKIDVYDLKEMLSVVGRGIGKFNDGFELDRLLVHFTAATWDPYLTARLFSYVNAFLSVIVPALDEKNRCPELDVKTQIDFNDILPTLDFGICITFRIGAIFGMIFSILFGVIWIFIKIIFRFLWMMLFDKEEYNYRMNEQEGPVKFFKRLIREGKALRAEAAGKSPESRPDADSETPQATA